MFEEDHAPVTLSEIYNQAASCQRSLEFARQRSRIFEQFLPLDSNTDIYAHAGQLLAYWRAAARDLNPDAPRHLARTVLLNI